MVVDLEKLSRAISDATPEKAVERALQEKAPQIEDALRERGVYEDVGLGVRISTTVPHR